MQLITIDFETYYDPAYSLSKMTTEEYIRDSRFEVIGVSVKVGTDDAQEVRKTNPRQLATTGTLYTEEIENDTKAVPAR